MSKRVKHRAEILAERLSLARLADQRDSPDAARWWQEVADALVRLHEAVEERQTAGPASIGLPTLTGERV